jgi:hypothetical protein
MNFHQIGIMDLTSQNDKSIIKKNYLLDKTQYVGAAGDSPKTTMALGKISSTVREPFNNLPREGLTLVRQYDLPSCGKRRDWRLIMRSCYKCDEKEKKNIEGVAWRFWGRALLLGEHVTLGTEGTKISNIHLNSFFPSYLQPCNLSFTCSFLPTATTNRPPVLSILFLTAHDEDIVTSELSKDRMSHRMFVGMRSTAKAQKRERTI